MTYAGFPSGQPALLHAHNCSMIILCSGCHFALADALLFASFPSCCNHFFLHASIQCQHFMARSQWVQAWSKSRCSVQVKRLEYAGTLLSSIPSAAGAPHGRLTHLSCRHAPDRPSCHSLHRRGTIDAISRAQHTNCNRRWLLSHYMLRSSINDVSHRRGPSSVARGSAQQRRGGQETAGEHIR